MLPRPRGLRRQHAAVQMPPGDGGTKHQPLRDRPVSAEHQAPVSGRVTDLSHAGSWLPWARKMMLVTGDHVPCIRVVHWWPSMLLASCWCAVFLLMVTCVLVSVGLGEGAWWSVSDVRDIAHTLNPVTRFCTHSCSPTYSHSCRITLECNYIILHTCSHAHPTCSPSCAG